LHFEAALRGVVEKLEIALSRVQQSRLDTIRAKKRQGKLQPVKIGAGACHFPSQ
jgi:hypothetical protein